MEGEVNQETQPVSSVETALSPEENQGSRMTVETVAKELGLNLENFLEKNGVRGEIWLAGLAGRINGVADRFKGRGEELAYAIKEHLDELVREGEGLDTDYFVMSAAYRQITGRPLRLI